MKLENNTAKKVKQDFPIFRNNPRLVYLDNAATSQKPKQVIAAVSRFYEKDNANVSRGVYELSARATKAYEDARSVVSRFINARPEEVIFTRNTTEALSLLSYTIESLIKKGKNEILITEMEHHSNFVPWQQLAKRKGFKLKVVEIKPDFTLDMEDLKQKLSDKTAIVAFPYVSNVLGTILDSKTVTKLAKQKGAITIVDAAQAIQSLKVDVKDIGCDFLAFSSHKMLGPMGIGVLYGKKELLEKMEPFNFGGGMIKNVTLEKTEWADAPYRFEAGTPSVADAVGLGEAIRYIEKIGIGNIEKWKDELLRYSLKKLKEVNGIEVYNAGVGKSTSIIAFNLKGIHPHDVSELLNSDRIAIRAGHHCAIPLMKTLNIKSVCRASLYIYNTFEDIDALVKSLNKIKEKFK